MNNSTDGALPGVRADWYIVPWGPPPGRPNTLRYSIRVVPQLCEVNGGDCFSIDALRNWPAHIAANECLKLQVIPSTSVSPGSRANLSQRYLAHLAELDLTLEQASRLWHAAIGDLVDKLVTALQSRTTIYRRALLPVSVPTQVHSSAAVVRTTEVRIADLCAGSLHRAAQLKAGSAAAAWHGRVEPVAPAITTVNMLRASAAIYAAPNKPQRAYEDVRQALLVRAKGQVDNWASTILESHAQAQSNSSAAKTGGSSGTAGAKVERTYLPYSITYLSYLLTVPRLTSHTLHPQEGDEIPLDEFGMRLADRRLAYASIAPAKVNPDQCAASPEEATPQQKTDILINEIQARISSMVVHPWLAKILGLTVDMALPLNGDVNQLKSIAVESFKQIDSAQQAVAQLMRTQLNGGFPQSSFNPTDGTYMKGVLNVSSRGEAFVLTQIDVDRAPERYVQTAVAFETQLQSGQVASKIAVAIQPQETVGLSLIECDGNRKLHALTRHDGGDNSSPRDVYLEQLLIGYRPDLQTLDPTANGDSRGQPWHALTARRIRRVRLGKLGIDVTAWFSKVGRCEALLPERTRTAKSNGTDEAQAFIEGEMFRWSTWGLGAGPAANAGPQDCSLAMGQTNAYDGGSQLSIEYAPVDVPPQRFGHQYRVGVRLAMIDGNSLAVSEAASVYDGGGPDATCTVGDDTYPTSPGKGTHPKLRGASFLRFEPVAPPTVLMTDRPVRDRFVKDAATHVVVASSASSQRSRERAWRALVPPRSTSLDLCTRHGMFDTFQPEDGWPPSAFADVALTPQGGFPVERGSNTGPLSRNKQSQEMYFRRPSIPPPAPRLRYYPDPWARRAILGFYRVGDDRLMHVEWFAYYEGGRTWPDCRELRLCVEVASTVKDPALGFEVRMSDNVVTVRLQAGVQVTLRVWHEVDAAMLEQSAVVEQMAQLALLDKAGTDLRRTLGIQSSAPYDIEEIRRKLVDKLSRWEQFRDWLSGPPRPFNTKSAMLNLTSFWMLNPFVEIDLLHAVDEPTRAPCLVQACDDSAAPSCTLPNACRASETKQPFQIYREAGQTKAMFRGHLYVNRTSTIRVDAAAHWSDNPPVASRTGNSGPYTAAPKSINAHLFALKDVAVVAIDDKGSPPSAPISAELPPLENFQLLQAKISIRKDDHAEDMPAVEEYDFMDTRARVVNVQLSGASRYADEFANLTPAEARRLSIRERVVVYGTKRPDPPEVEYVVPVFNWTDAAVSSPDQIGRTREAGWFRIWLGPTWYSSGNGELLALLCWPGSVTEPKKGALRRLIQCDTGDAYTEPDPAIERYITRWGLDALVDEQISFGNLPIDALRNRLRKPGDLQGAGGPPDLLEVDVDHLQGIANFDPVIDLARLPEFAKTTFKPATKGAAPASQVTLALYRPQLDDSTGKMFVDIQLDPRAAYQPFVRLGLARYQARGLSDDTVDCRLSTIVSTEFVQLLPERTASLSVTRTNGGNIESIQIALSGTTLANSSPASCRSRFVATVEQRRLSFVAPDVRDEINGAWLPANVAPESMELSYQPVERIWSGKLPLRTRVAHEYSIRIEEYEMLPVDTVDGSGRLVYFDRLMIRDL
ncbi:Uncharacterised protein [Burkholderia pseudomallei]|nr:Uncharacterised protein [Burkholderia pseudomallei]CAJ8045617.1 Uncharacterised protein [Burkholderia pseudomallei]